MARCFLSCCLGVRFGCIKFLLNAGWSFELARSTQYTGTLILAGNLYLDQGGLPLWVSQLYAIDLQHLNTLKVQTVPQDVTNLAFEHAHILSAEILCIRPLADHAMCDHYILISSSSTLICRLGRSGCITLLHHTFQLGLTLISPQLRLRRGIPQLCLHCQHCSLAGATGGCRGLRLLKLLHPL